MALRADFSWYFEARSHRSLPPFQEHLNRYLLVKSHTITCDPFYIVPDSREIVRVKPIASTISKTPIPKPSVDRYKESPVIALVMRLAAGAHLLADSDAIIDLCLC